MKVSIVRGGGLAGMVTTTSLDTDDLTAHDAATLRAKVDQAEVHQSHRRGTETTPTQPDRFSYELTIEDNDKRQTLRIRDQDLSPELNDLITWVHNSPARRQKVRPPGQ